MSYDETDYISCVLEMDNQTWEFRLNDMQYESEFKAFVESIKVVSN